MHLQAKKKSLNYLSPYFVIAFRKSLIENPYFVFFPLADLVYQNTSPQFAHKIL